MLIVSLMLFLFSASLQGNLLEDRFPVTPYEIEKALPRGYTKDGKIDYTTFIQGAIDGNKEVIFPAFPLLINDKGLSIGSNKTVTFRKGSELRLKSSSKSKYGVLNIKNAHSVLLINPVVVGDRLHHLGTAGEWGMGINIESSSNITIESPVISNCWGDGIYITQSKLSPPSKNISVNNAQLLKNRRNGISIISVEGLTLKNIFVHGLAVSEGGTRPMSGIDFEPNNSSNELKGIVVDGLKTQNMGAEGIQIMPKRMYGHKSKTVDITINGHEDIGSPLAAVYIEFKNLDNKVPIRGAININNPVWKRNPKYVLFALGFNEPNVKLNINSPRIYGLNDQLLDPSSTLEKIKKFTRSNVSLSYIK